MPGYEECPEVLCMLELLRVDAVAIFPASAGQAWRRVPDEDGHVKLRLLALDVAIAQRVWRHETVGALAWPPSCWVWSVAEDLLQLVSQHQRPYHS